MRIRKADIRKLESVSVILLILFVIITFAFSIIIGSRDAKTNNKELTTNEIAEYARLFLPDKPNWKRGKWMDCSGYTHYVYKQFSIKIPSSSSKQFQSTKRLTIEDLRKGDLVFFNTNKNGVSHVGIFLENGYFIHSPGKNKNVRIDSLTNIYYKQRFISGGRITFNSYNN